MKKSNQQHIGDVIKKLLKNQKLSERLQELDVISSCEELLGKNLMKYIKEITFRKGKLIIKVKSSAARNELAFQKSKLITKLNQKTGKEIVKEFVLK
ncbi:MAG: DUF721 domain-containing protein [Flavobacteriales bacterium]|nr:DUF721 domain-containing protein [Flavobacteriales bacterium]